MIWNCKCGFKTCLEAIIKVFTVSSDARTGFRNGLLYIMYISLEGSWAEGRELGVAHGAISEFYK